MVYVKRWSNYLQILRKRVYKCITSFGKAKRLKNVEKIEKHTTNEQIWATGFQKCKEILGSQITAF